jgi:hypothetical protein
MREMSSVVGWLMHGALGWQWKVAGSTGIPGAAIA